MVEAPPPPPGLDYNTFRTWRKNNNIRSTKEELSITWKDPCMRGECKHLGTNH